MIRKAKKLIIQERRKDYGEEAVEGTKALSQGDDEFNGADDEFKEARAEENAFHAARAEDSAERSRSQRAGNMDGYEMGTAKNPKEEEEE